MRETAQELHVPEDPMASPVLEGTGAVGAESETEGQSPEEAVEYVLADCSFAVGQTIGMRMSLLRNA